MTVTVRVQLLLISDPEVRIPVLPENQTVDPPVALLLLPQVLRVEELFIVRRFWLVCKAFVTGKEITT